MKERKRFGHKKAGIQPAFLCPAANGRVKNAPLFTCNPGIKILLILHARNSGKSTIHGAFRGINLP
jgi:hypothetical protein